MSSPFYPEGPEPRFEGYRARSLFPDTRAMHELVLALLRAHLLPRTDLVGVQGKGNGSGRHDGEFWQDARCFLKTRQDRKFTDEGQAIRAFARLCAMKLKLDSLTPAKSLMVVLQSPAGTFEVWTVAPLLFTLREELNAAHAQGNEAALCRGLVAYAHCLGRALESAEQLSLSIDAHPANFARQGGRPRYIDDDAAERRDAVGIEDAFLARISDYPDVSEETWVTYALRFCAEAKLQLPEGSLTREALPERLRHAARLKPSTSAWAEHIARLLEA
jgi:hypothetical protein